MAAKTPQSSDTAHALKNVMEHLVAEEVERQRQQLTPKVARYITPLEVIAYALNRLPALYATSQTGWERQIQRGKQEFGPQIAAAVRQGIAAIQQDPLRLVHPLDASDSVSAQTALQELKVLFRYENLSWDNLVSIVKAALIQTAKAERRPGKAHPISDPDFFDWEQVPPNRQS